MAEKDSKKAVCIVNEKGSTVMAMNSMKRDGNKIAINGVLMGAWPSDMYMGPEDAAKMVSLIFKSPSVIFYILSLPFILPKWRKEKLNKEQTRKGK